MYLLVSEQYIDASTSAEDNYDQKLRQKRILCTSTFTEYVLKKSAHARQFNSKTSFHLGGHVPSQER